jgi:hypothetical protein
VLMSFSVDPKLGMVTDRCTGNAVVFLATATFTAQTTASLRPVAVAGNDPKRNRPAFRLQPPPERGSA